MNKYNAFALASLWGSDVPVVVSERDSPKEILPRIRVWARDLLYPYAAGVICQTQAGRDFITSRISMRRATVIPNPVDRVIEPSERQRDRVVLGVGRFVQKKAFSQLIEAFANMEARDWRLVLCGDGPLRADLERDADTFGVSDRIEFPGLVADLRPYFLQAGLFALPSLSEGYPNALAEAMVSGLPCVSYDCATGPSDLITQEDNGLLVPVGDVEALAAALDRLASDSELAERLGARAALSAEHLNPGRIAELYLTFCEQAASADSAI
jgi:glycosyltransferase involved in cell wall biosynthesis